MPLLHGLRRSVEGASWVWGSGQLKRKGAIGAGSNGNRAKLVEQATAATENAGMGWNGRFGQLGMRKQEGGVFVDSYGGGLERAKAGLCASVSGGRSSGC